MDPNCIIPKTAPTSLPIATRTERESNDLIDDFFIFIMGFWDFVEAATPWSTVEAEAPAKEEEVCTFVSFDWG